MVEYSQSIQPGGDLTQQSPSFYPKRAIVDKLDECTDIIEDVSGINPNELQSMFSGQHLIPFIGEELPKPRQLHDGEIVTDWSYLRIKGPCPFFHQMGLTEKFECTNPNRPRFCATKVRMG